MKRYCFALDLVDDPALIAEYDAHHSNVPFEINKSISDAGIINMEIYRTGSRLCMMMETHDSFSFEKKDLMDAKNPHVQEWEKLMWKFQLPLPWAREGEKWILMNKVYQL